jgi:hypothetical protein
MGFGEVNRLNAIELQLAELRDQLVTLNTRVEVLMAGQLEIAPKRGPGRPPKPKEPEQPEAA